MADVAFSKKRKIPIKVLLAEPYTVITIHNNYMKAWSACNVSRTQGGNNNG